VNHLGVSQIRISQIENGKIEQFELGTLNLSVSVGDKTLGLLSISFDTVEVWGD
jgi:predicted XRE-type DNA-binding protein